MLYSHDLDVPQPPAPAAPGVVIDLVGSPDVSAPPDERRVKLKKRKLDLGDASSGDDNDDPTDLRKILCVCASERLRGLDANRHTRARVRQGTWVVFYVHARLAKWRPPDACRFDAQGTLPGLGRFTPLHTRIGGPARARTQEK